MPAFWADTIGPVLECNRPRLFVRRMTATEQCADQIGQHQQPSSSWAVRYPGETAPGPLWRAPKRSFPAAYSPQLARDIPKAGHNTSWIVHGPPCRVASTLDTLASWSGAPPEATHSPWPPYHGLFLLRRSYRFALLQKFRREANHESAKEQQYCSEHSSRIEAAGATYLNSENQAGKDK
jgi:hypothetical protein